MSNSEIADTLSYLTDEQLLARHAAELETHQEQDRAIRRTTERRERLFKAVVARGLA